MPLIEARRAIAPSAVDALEEILAAVPAAGWTLQEDRATGRHWLVGFFAGHAAAMAAWRELVRLAGARRLRGQPALRTMPDADWRESYKAHFKPSRFGRLHWVPVWKRAAYRVPPGDRVVWLDPGMAFGTGDHETTRLCAERLVEAAGSAGGTKLRVIDVGCGSGILAISAAKLGCRSVAGFDHDPEAVRISRENARLNGLGGRVRFHEGDFVVRLAGRTADLVLANIFADVPMDHARELMHAVAPGGRLVLGGILAVELPAVRAAFAAVAPGWTVDSRTLGEWADLMLTRPARGGGGHSL